ncbi:cisplatin damage response ATP-dependent DNA ligase [Alteriqipengyuania flavescens]|uniref:cisplatin damage response ATP-dependent DNA ligase n=1 Tax=Alteriqipengyuania flavescens TaxID=3053610 RepID=UPI0025B3BED4|nr:cisplatin damage response ATP-dependent DNA ligase [Alteriqipengyuania flavescens]WJY19566.1 cisplatin damage response ATP-dependent DNA ligase [Alteriqipengyuania flavescens]WJY25506.1 cisplatin damage response ATP-dependent DNA ligase [Alteriqipengyuania flavescens]
MEEFAALIDRLVYTRSRNEKLRLIAEYLRATPDPDRGWALTALTDGLDFPAVKSSTIRNVMKERVDPVLWTLSRDFVGDTAETASLLWPAPAHDGTKSPSVGETVDLFGKMTRANVMTELPKLLDRLDISGRYALLKLATGAMRIGVSSRLGKVAFAQAFDVSVEDVEEYWHGLQPPYAELFAWAADGADPPDIANLPTFRPFMLAHPLEDTVVDLADYAAEWKWDGIRVQLVHAGGETRVYSRSGDDISATFPEMVDALAIPAVLDGELLVRGDTQGGAEGGAASFNALQQRLGRKTVSKKMLRESPAFVRLYDALILDGEDLRDKGWEQRRARLETFMARLPDTHFDISRIVEAENFDALAKIREGTRDDAIEGLMLKRRDSPYVAGRRTGLWYKWKRDPLLIDCVLMYAQRGSGKRSSFFSDYTFGCWDGDPDAGGELLPVGKAYSGFTDDELKKLDRHVRQNTTNRFGPVRETNKSLVFEVAFDSVHESKRHKSGLAMRFPRIHRIRWDKPVHEADRIEALRALIRD